MIIPNICGWLLVSIAAAWILGGTSDRSDKTPIWWRGIVLGAVVAFRWPGLTAPYDFNPDESQSLAGALTLTHDPRFWISVDGATAGPLHFFAEIPAALFPAPVMYFAERLIAILLVLGIVFLVGILLRTAYEATVAETVELSTGIAFAMTRTADFQYVSTELVGLTLVVAAIVLALHKPANSSPAFREFSIGLLLGAVPFAKLQLGPIAAAFGIYLAIRDIVEKRPISGLLIGAALPALATAAYLTTTHSWDDALIPYFLSNIEYAGDAGLTIAAVAVSFARDLWRDIPIGSWVVVGAGICASGLWASTQRRQRGPGLARLAIAGLFLASICVLIPRRPYLHYTYLLLPFWVLLVGCALGQLIDGQGGAVWARRRSILAACLVGWCVPVGAASLTEIVVPSPPPYAAVWHRQNEELAAVIAKYSCPGDMMAIWGIRSELFLLTKLPQAVPQAHCELQIWANQWQHYYLRRYAEMFERNRPAVFVDAVGPGNFLFKHRAEAHEAFLPLALAVHDRYTAVAERYGTRIYIRNDRLPGASSVAVRKKL